MQIEWKRREEKKKRMRWTRRRRRSRIKRGEEIRGAEKS